MLAKIFTNSARSENTDSRIQVNPKENGSKQIHPETHHNQTTENKKERKKNLESNIYLYKVTIQIRIDFSSATTRP